MPDEELPDSISGKKFDALLDIENKRRIIKHPYGWYVDVIRMVFI